MTQRLIATKLSLPKLREGIVGRSRLSARLRLGTQSRLTLVSAPAGFGKTTLLAEWLAARAPGQRAVAWLSLDQTDNEPSSFWSHVIAALEAAAAGIGARIEGLGGQQPGAPFLADMLNQLSALHTEVDLVLDDYHVIDHKEIESGLAFLIEHLPPHIHVVLSTRADPALPLARLRASGELVEVRSADLRFTAEEASAYLNEAMGLGLAAGDVARLEERTEGWIAALQLAVLSIKGRDDASEFIAGFAGSDRYIVDYLLEEVLQRQPEAVRSFLSRTCLLSRLSGSLCDAVTGAGGTGKAMLEALDRQNLFVVRLDDQRQWYRYHHLFADVLMAHLGEAERAELPMLHRRASDWFEASGERGEAIRHALAGADFAHAADLIERALPDMQKNRGEAIIRGWAHTLPAALVRARPVLGIGLVGGMASFGEFEGLEERLREIEQGLAALAEAGRDGTAATGVVVVDESQLPRVPGAIELYRAALAQVRGDVPGLIAHAERVLEVAPADDHLGRAAGSSLLGIGYWSLGELEAAHRWWSEGRSGLQRAGHIADMLGVSVALADIDLVRGRLGEAIRGCEQALALSAAHGGRVLRGTADMHAGLSELYRERNDLPAAHRHLSRSQELGERAGLPQHPYRWRVAAARLRRDEGDLAGADRLLDEAERLYVSDFFPPVRPVAAMRARIWIAQSRLDAALGWQRDSGLGVDDALSYLREFEHITLARLLLAQAEAGQGGGPAGLPGFIDRLLEAAECGGRLGSVIEISILSALARRQVDLEAALGALERALTLAAPEGYSRLFIDEGQPMAALLRVAIKRRIVPGYAGKLLAAFGEPEERPSPHPDLIEALSERELDVLRLLRSDLDGPEIARELGVSLNTLRTHTKNIFEKLDVNNRRSAVRRAEELKLLAGSPRR